MVSFSNKSTRIIALIIGLICLIGAVINYSKAYSSYNQAKLDVAKYNESVHVEVLRTTTSDHKELKGILMVDPLFIEYTNQSIPLVFVQHGMSSDYLDFQRTSRTLISMGYAVFSPESRGHGSNTAPSSLGYFEAFDVVHWLDVLETTKSFINVSASGLYAHSLGAMYSMMAYILESQGEARFKAIASVSGPLNLTREFDFLTNDPSAIGEIGFTTKVVEKSPINYMNATFPQNVLLMHGNKDDIVDYQCSKDAAHVMDPTGTRNGTDFLFITVDGQGHSIGSHTSIVQQSIAWLDHYIRGSNLIPEAISLVEDSIPTSQASLGKSALMDAGIYLSIALPLLIFALAPKLYTYSSSDSLKELPLITDSKERRKYGRIILLFFVGASVIAALLPIYLANELVLGAIAIWGFIFYLLFKLTKNEPSQSHYSALSSLINLKASLWWVLSVFLGFGIYFGISSMPSLENATILPGARVTWWVPFMTAYFTLFLSGIFIVIRLIWGDPYQQNSITKSKAYFREILLFAGFAAFGTAIFAIWHPLATLSIPVWGITGSLLLSLLAIFGVLFLVFGIFYGFTIKLTKTPIPGAMLLGLVVAIFAGGGSLIFFY